MAGSRGIINHMLNFQHQLAWITVNGIMMHSAEKYVDFRNSFHSSQTTFFTIHRYETPSAPEWSSHAACLLSICSSDFARTSRSCSHHNHKNVWHKIWSPARLSVWMTCPCCACSWSTARLQPKTRFTHKFYRLAYLSLGDYLIKVFGVYRFIVSPERHDLAMIAHFLRWIFKEN